MTGVASVLSRRRNICFIDAGSSASRVGYLRLNWGTSYGLVGGAVRINGVEVNQVEDTNFGSAVFSVSLEAGSLAQSFFTSITINGVTFSTASADSFSPLASTTTWQWNGSAGLVDGQRYSITAR